jgi:hypothetical protein
MNGEESGFNWKKILFDPKVILSVLVGGVLVYVYLKYIAKKLNTSAAAQAAAKSPYLSKSPMVLKGMGSMDSVSHFEDLGDLASGNTPCDSVAVESGPSPASADFEIYS